MKTRARLCPFDAPASGCSPRRMSKPRWRRGTRRRRAPPATKTRWWKTDTRTQIQLQEKKTKNRVAERAKAFAVWEATEAERLKSEIVAMKAEVEEDELAVATLEAMARDYGLKKEEIRRDTRDRIRKMSEELRKAKRRHERQKEKLAADLSFPAFGAYGEDDVDRIQGGPEVEEVNQRDNFAKMGSSSEDFYADSELGHDYDSQLFRRAGAANADGVPQLESIHRNQRSMTSGSALLENGITCILEEGEDDFDEEF
mmetsp:Transcript_17766/g.44421  ORF Transcript_17766/g.44421 Transcript_17766/m.44421 type:complete len:257 (-) Transcript_17766:125-895(-)